MAPKVVSAIPKMGKLVRNLTPLSPKGAAAQALRKFGEGALSKLQGFHSKYPIGSPKSRYFGSAIEHARGLQGKGPVPVASLLNDVPTAKLVGSPTGTPQPTPRLEAPYAERTVRTIPKPTPNDFLSQHKDQIHQFHFNDLSIFANQAGPTGHLTGNNAKHSFLDNYLRDKTRVGGGKVEHDSERQYEPTRT